MLWIEVLLSVIVCLSSFINGNLVKCNIPAATAGSHGFIVNTNFFVNPILEYFVGSILLFSFILHVGFCEISDY